MRIRKRQVPLPLSSLSPIPVSDPLSPMVQLHRRHDPHQNLYLQADATFSPPSDHPNQPIGSRTDGLDCSAAAGLNLKVLSHGEEDNKRGEDEEEAGLKKKSNDTGKNNILGAEIAAAGVLSQLSSSHQVVGRWGEGEKAFPLKKRRGSFERRGEDEEEEKEKKMKTKMKTKMNKKFAVKNGNEEEEERETKESNVSAENNTNTSSKKSARSGAIMEGSRCSRVNGRGWRCCQLTLVGYSLCEHHLGKGRLRSMTSFRSRSLGSSAPRKNVKSKQQPLPTLEDCKIKLELGDDQGEVDDKKPVMINARKKMKLGMVKARSISSLLGQNDSERITSDNL